MATIKSYNKRLESLRSERSSFIPLYRQLSDYHLAHRGRFLTSDRNKGFKRDTKQYNNRSRLASRTLAAGMMAGITSPGRPWFRLTTGDPYLADRVGVREWLHDVQKVLYRIFSASNTYNSLHMVYSELGVFGTAPMGVFDDFENVIWCKPYTCGSYMLGADGKGNINTFYREFEFTVSQVVHEYGLENCSNTVRDLWKRGNTEAWVKIVHLVEPNDDRDNNSPLARHQAFRSTHYEFDRESADEDKYLRESGFREFPILAPRWDVSGEDIYATDCPGMTSLGDAKALQLGERRLYQAIGKSVNPPLQGPSTLKNKVSAGVNEGEIVWTDEQIGLRSIYENNYRPAISDMRSINNVVEDRIARAFYEDLFLMLANDDRRQITAREVAEKHEEKLLMLGPVLERVHNELLDKLIDRAFNVAQDAGILPPPPEELDNTELKVEYVSVLAQAQQLIGVGAIERVATFAGNLTAVWPEARHKINPAQAIDDYAEANGVDPKMIRGDDEVAAMTAAEQQQAAQAAAMEQGQQLAQTAKVAGETRVDDQGTALGAVMRRAGLA